MIPPTVTQNASREMLPRGDASNQVPHSSSCSRLLSVNKQLRRTGLTRSALLRRAAVVSGASIAGAAAIGGLAAPAISAPSPEDDDKSFAYLLELEDLQSAFYAEALSRGSLTGEAKEFARVVGEHEREHAAYLRKALGATAAKATDFDFGATTASRRAFLRTAVEIEETGLAAYTGAAVNLTSETLTATTRIVSVEARHAAWVRDLVGRDPAPNASDKAATEAEVRAAVARIAKVREG